MVRPAHISPQLAAGVIAGKRPELPPREELPGPDTAQVCTVIVTERLCREAD